MCSAPTWGLCCACCWPSGNPQPAYKLEGMKILMEFPKPKDEEQMANAMPEVERKQVSLLTRRHCALCSLIVAAGEQ